MHHASTKAPAAAPFSLSTFFRGSERAGFEERLSKEIDSIKDLLVNYEAKDYDIHFLIDTLLELKLVHPVHQCPSCMKTCVYDENAENNKFWLFMRCPDAHTYSYELTENSLFHIRGKSVVDQLLIWKGFMEGDDPKWLEKKIFMSATVIREYFDELHDRVAWALQDLPPSFHCRCDTSSYEVSLRKIVCNQSSNEFFYVGGILDVATDQCIFSVFPPDSEHKYRDDYLRWLSTLITESQSRNECEKAIAEYARPKIRVQVSSDRVLNDQYTRFFKDTVEIQFLSNTAFRLSKLFDYMQTKYIKKEIKLRRVVNDLTFRSDSRRSFMSIFQADSESRFRAHSD